MNLVEAFVLGAIQGITEWLPVSSSGHLVLAQELFDLDASENLLFDLIVHLGTLLAVCGYFYRELGRIAYSLFSRKANRTPQIQALRTLGFLLILATIPVAIVGLLLTDWIDSIFNARIVAAALIVNGLMLMAFERLGSGGTRRNARLLDSIIIGLFQAISIVPGISRSGWTIGGGMLRGLEREIAAVFAFLVSVPTLGGAFVYGLLTLESYDLDLLSAITGLFVAFATGLLAIQYLLKAVRQGKLWVFGGYCILAGLIALVFIA